MKKKGFEKNKDDELEAIEMEQAEAKGEEIFPKSYYLATKAQNVLAFCLGLFTLYTCFAGLLTDVIQRSTFLAFVMPMVFLNAFTKKRKQYGKVMKITALVFAVLSAAIFAYYAFNYERIGMVLIQVGKLPQFELILCICGILLVLEASRRMMGPAISIIAIVFIIIALIGGKYLPFLHMRVYTLNRVVRELFVSSAGVFATPIGTACTIIIMFVIFGAFLEANHGSDVFMDIAFALTGRSTGGPAKAAVVSSGLVGCISGSASANVATTGVFTIPLMKKAGYDPVYAGAVEAVASTGSQIMPPIMGSAAFIIAETLGLPFRTIAAAAIIPALLYYISVFLSVHYESKKRGLVGMAKEDIPNAWITVRKYGLSLIPLVVLITMIVMGYGAMFCALIATGVGIFLSWFYKIPEVIRIARENKLSTGKVLLEVVKITLVKDIKSLVKGCKGVMSIATACAAAGIVIGVLGFTGLGIRLSGFIVNLSGGHLIIALILTEIALFIMGMGLPTAPAYILVSTLVAPALTRMGVPELAAHLFVFYGACLSSITPPVAMAAYTAAGISGASPIKIGVQSVKLAIVTYIAPIFFVYAPQLIGQGSIGSIIMAMISAIIGCLGLSTGVVGYFMAKMNPVFRFVAFGCGLCCIFPGIVTDVIGYAGIIGILFVNYLIARKHRSDAKPA